MNKAVAMAASLLAPLKLLAVFVLLFGAGVVACVLEGASYVLVRPFSLKLHRRLVTLVSHAFLLVGTLLLQRWSRIRLVTHGDALPKMASAMFIVNHCSNIDWYVIFSSFPNPKLTVRPQARRIGVVGAFRLSVARKRQMRCQGLPRLCPDIRLGASPQ